MPSVLVVDDEDQIRLMLRDALEQAGYGVIEGRSGKEALEQYRQAPIDLVIMDILMPDKDGIEGIIELRQEFPDAKIIAITGGGTQDGTLDFLDVARMLGAERAFHKPFELKELVGAVDALLKN